jgi:hypothetical protein
MLFALVFRSGLMVLSNRVISSLASQMLGQYLVVQNLTAPDTFFSIELGGQLIQETAHQRECSRWKAELQSAFEVLMGSQIDNSRISKQGSAMLNGIPRSLYRRRLLAV